MCHLVVCLKKYLMFLKIINSENFCLLLLEPVQVDHLELRGEPQNRWVYYRNENQEWLTEAINP